MNPSQAIAIASIWLSVGFTGYFTDNQFTIAAVSVLAFFATTHVAREN